MTFEQMKAFRAMAENASVVDKVLLRAALNEALDAIKALQRANLELRGKVASLEREMTARHQ